MPILKSATGRGEKKHPKRYKKKKKMHALSAKIKTQVISRSHVQMKVAGVVCPFKCSL